MPSEFFRVAVMAFIAAAAASAETPIDREQLPSGLTPLHYDLTLVPDTVNLRFHGRVRITVEVQVSTPVVVLNAAELAFDRVGLDQEEQELPSNLTRSFRGRRSRFFIPGPMFEMIRQHKLCFLSPALSDP